MSKNKRVSISKKTRFEVFKRDLFTCQYCSAKPPKVPLEIDHIIPICKNGTNHIDNLITSCFDCNRGESGNELTVIPATLADKIEKMKLAKSQYKLYQKLLQEQNDIIDSEISEVESVYTSSFNGWCFSSAFRISVKKFIENLGHFKVKENMAISCDRIHDQNNVLKYFCGICWTNIRES